LRQDHLRLTHSHQVADPALNRGQHLSDSAVGTDRTTSQGVSRALGLSRRRRQVVQPLFGNVGLLAFDAQAECG